MRLGLALSAAVHAGAAAALLLPWAGGDRLPVSMPPIEVELIQVSTAGAAPQPVAEPAAQPAPAAPPAPSPATQPSRPSSAISPPSATPPEAAPAAPPRPASSQSAASQPATPQPAAPQPAAPRTAPAPAAVNLGNGGQDLADLNARSDDVVPPRPDSRHRNLPPAYPAEAMRRRQEGTVHLTIHVAADGIPILVEVAGSSGHPSLDQAAVQAVERWRFTPARGAAGPVPFSYPLDIHFVGDRT